MPAANITVNDKWATVECDDVLHTITVEGVGGSLVNVGAARVFLGMAKEALARDGAQHDDEIWLDANDSIPVPAQASQIKNQCAAGTTSKLFYVPRLG